MFRFDGPVVNHKDESLVIPIFILSSIIQRDFEDMSVFKFLS